MPEWATNQRLALTLTASAPSSTPGKALPVPATFYSAFPELNDVGPDGARSAFPQRAKYSVPFDSEFVPTGIEQVDPQVLDNFLKVAPELRDSLVEVRTTRPREDADEDTYYFQKIFELAHKRLAASGARWAFRTFLLAPFYTALERFIALRRTITVPLYEDHRGSALERQWAAIGETIRPMQRVDEAVSLLVGLALHQERVQPGQREIWIAEQDNELGGGFAAVFHELEARFDLGACDTLAEREAVAENVVRWGQATLALPPGRRLRRLPVPKDLAAGYPGLPAAVQRLLAHEAMLADQGKTFTRDDRWPEYVGFRLQGTASAGPVLLTAPLGGDLLALIHAGIPRLKGQPATWPDAYFVASYAIFVEAMRQQICTGVGLRCPFRSEEGCCDLWRIWLQRVYEITVPVHPVWGPHWQCPPCLA